MAVTFALCDGGAWHAGGGVLNNSSMVCYGSASVARGGSTRQVARVAVCARRVTAVPSLLPPLICVLVLGYTRYRKGTLRLAGVVVCRWRCGILCSVL